MICTKLNQKEWMSLHLDAICALATLYTRHRGEGVAPTCISNYLNTQFTDGRKAVYGDITTWNATGLLIPFVETGTISTEIRAAGLPRKILYSIDPDETDTYQYVLHLLAGQKDPNATDLASIRKQQIDGVFSRIPLPIQLYTKPHKIRERMGELVQVQRRLI